MDFAKKREELIKRHQDYLKRLKDQYEKGVADDKERHSKALENIDLVEALHAVNAAGGSKVHIDRSNYLISYEDEELLHGVPEEVNFLKQKGFKFSLIIK